MILVMKAEDPAPVALEQVRARRQRVDFVQIEQQREHPIAEGMSRGADSPVADEALIDGGHRHARAPASCGTRAMRSDSPATRHGRCTPPASSAAANPACSASSWKPEPK